MYEQFVPSMPPLSSHIYRDWDNLTFNMYKIKTISSGLIKDLLSVRYMLKMDIGSFAWSLAGSHEGLPRKVLLISRIHVKHNRKLGVERTVLQG